MKTTKKSVAAEYCQKFPDASDHAIARILCRDVSDLFSNHNAARLSVRDARGLHSNGDGYRKSVDGIKPGKVNAKNVFEIPEGIRQLGEWGPVPVNIGKAVVIADMHLPYHEKSVIECAVNFGVKQGCDTVILLGDAVDFFSCSRFESDPRKRDLQNELGIARTVIQEIGRNFNKKIYIMGNHEERWEKYLWVKAPELTGVADFAIERVLQLDGWNVVKNKQPVVIGGGLHFVHGHEWGGMLTNPVNPARGCYLRSKVSTVCGHHHQPSEHSEPDLSGKLVTCWSLGCACELHPEYRPINKYAHSFGYLECPTEDSWRFDNKKVIKGHIV